jgi:hypothetical protein
VALTADAPTGSADRDTYITGLSGVLDAIERDVPTPPRTLLVSSTAVYDIADGSWVDENTPAAPSTPTSTALREAEELHPADCPVQPHCGWPDFTGPGAGGCWTVCARARRPSRSRSTSITLRENGA